jgi:ABC-2 type transport system ATP-binding protein
MAGTVVRKNSEHVRDTRNVYAIDYAYSIHISGLVGVEMDMAVQVDGLRKSFGDAEILQGIDLAIPHGTIFGLLGPNGAGKTTLIRILATLLPFDEGRVRVNGYDVAGEPAGVRRTIGLTGQYASVDELLTGRENLLLLGRLAHLDRASARRRTVELLEQFDLSDAADQRTRTYSGGMRRRLDLAASLLAAPPVVIFDEPTTGLDPRSRKALWEIIRRLASQGTTVLLTTQYLEEADALADEIAVLDHGVVVTRGTPRQLKAQVGTDRLRVQLRHAVDLGRAARLLHTSSVDRQTHTLTIPLAGPDGLRSALNALFDAGIELEHLQLSPPTLDDVFFATTSHSRAEPSP